MPEDEGGSGLKPYRRCFEKKYSCYLKKKKIITLEDDFYDFSHSRFHLNMLIKIKSET